MLLAYSKNSPTTYVLHYQNGKVRREGPGLAFWYYRPPSTIVAIPLASRDVPFAFSEVTADFQPVTLQGQLTYRVADPRRLAGLLDFSVRPTGQYTTDDPDKLSDRLIQTAQIRACCLRCANPSSAVTRTRRLSRAGSKRMRRSGSNR